jgi:predicted phage terminase large subunit-like protein
MPTTTVSDPVADALQLLKSPAFVELYEKSNSIERIAFDWRLSWLSVAHVHQILPAGDWWSIWLLLAGRGAGKTRTAAEQIGWWAWTMPKTRWLVAAPTSSDVRGVCYEGDSGLLSVIPQQLIADYNKQQHEITLINKSLIKGIPASEPDRFRGPQFHGAWFDELAAWDYLQESWDMAMFGIRLGTHTRILATTTPKPKELIVSLIEREGDDVTLTTASTYANLANLAPSFKKQILQYEGTTLGRQELHAEIIDPEEAGIVRRGWFKLWENDKPLPQFEFVVQSYDCATSDKTINDATAFTVWGVFKPSPDKPMSVMMIDCWSEHLQYPDMKERVIDEYDSIYGDENEFGNGKRPDLILVEDKSAGISLIQDLGRAQLPVRAYNPGRADKTMRLNIVSPIIQRGLVYLPESGTKKGYVRDWCEPFVNQVCSFPNATRDDYVDSMSQALRVLRDMSLINIDPVGYDDDTYDEDRPRRYNPYAQ